jgi:hypothetical protein
VYPNGNGIGTITFATPRNRNTCTDQRGHNYDFLWTRGTAAPQSVRFLATVSNQRASASQVFAYWSQDAPAGRSIIGLRMDFSGIFTSAEVAQNSTRVPTGVCTAAEFEPFRLMGIDSPPW